MTTKRLWQTFRMWTMFKSTDRVAYLRKNKVFAGIGENVTIMDRKIPLYANLIRIHNNVRVASNVTFATHDVTHRVLGSMQQFSEKSFVETVGCIELMDNVFIGTNCTIVGGVRIGPNAIVAAGAVVSKDVPPNSVVGGVPAKVICTLEQYVAKRKNLYPEDMAPKNQEVSDELAAYMWESFEKDRNESL